MKKPILLAGLLALAACADTPAQSIAKAKAEFAANDYATARIHIASALEADPNNREMLLLQAKTLLALGDGDAARMSLDKLAAGKPLTGEAAELAAEAALLRKVPDVALKLLGNAAGPEAERLRAIAALEKQDLKAAQDHFEKAMVAGGNGRAFADYARFRLMSGDIAGANELAAKAAKAAPDTVDTLLIEGQLALRRGDLKRSLERYARAAKLFPHNLAALAGQAAVLGDLGRIEEMQEIIDKAATVAPRDPVVVFLRAKVASKRKDWVTVRSLIQPIEASLDQLDPMRQLYGEALLRLGQAEQAIAQIKPIAGAMPNNREAQLLLGEAQIASGDPVSALEILGPLARHPAARPDEIGLAALAAREAKDPSAREFEVLLHQPTVQAIGRDVADADAAMRAGNWGGAAESYRRVLELTDGRNVLVLNNMAYAQTMLGNHDKAIEFAARAMKLAPNNASVLDTAGWAQLRSGKNREEALRLLRRASELAPKNTTIRAHLAEAERARS